MWCFRHVVRDVSQTELLKYTFELKSDGKVLGVAATAFQPVSYHIDGEGAGHNPLPVLNLQNRLGYLVIHVRVADVPDVPASTKVPDVPTSTRVTDVPEVGPDFVTQYEPMSSPPAGVTMYENALQELFEAPAVTLQAACRKNVEQGDPKLELRWLKAGLGCLGPSPHACQIGV